MTRDISLKVWLISGFLLAGLIPIMIVSLIGFTTAKTELQTQAFHHLESVRNIKKEQIQNFFLERNRNLTEFANNPFIAAAFKNLSQVFQDAGGAEGGCFKGLLNERYSAPLAYQTIHNQYMAYFKDLIQIYGYYDLFLMTAEHGDTLFTVRKESDFGIRIGDIESSLRDVWLKSKSELKNALSDTRPYSPSQGIPAQFLAAPIIEQGRVIGIIAVQISIDSIDEIMKERSGMWASGETYLVGHDYKMRSDSYLDRIDHTVQASFNGTVEKNGVWTKSTRLALTGQTGMKIVESYQNKRVLSAYTPIESFGLKWAIIAEVDKKEIDQRIAQALNSRIIVLFFISAFILLCLSWIISTFFDRGIKSTSEQMKQMIQNVLQGNLQSRGDTDSVGTDFKEVVAEANRLIDAFVKQLDERKKLEKHIQSNQRIKAIGILAGGIAHDFNNILTSLFAYTHIIRSETAETHPSQETLKEMQATLRRAGELVEQILTFGRSSKIERQEIEIHQMVEETIRLIRSTFPKNIRVEYGPNPRPLFIRAVPSQVNQILMNLCTNAQQAMQPQGGDLQIRLSEVDQKEGIPSDQKEGPYCVISVSDTGHGIPPSIIKHIFEPFFSTKPAEQGCGIGLSIVHGIILNHGGAISVDSIPGQGTVFHVFLPLISPLEMAPTQRPETPCLKGSGEHILLVDDEPSICQSERMVLESWGYQVTTLTDSRQVADLIRQKQPPFDLVISDLNMPHLDGIDLAELIFSIHPALPVIISTGGALDSQIHDNPVLKKTKIVGFLKKPYDQNQLAGLISQTLSSAPTPDPDP